MNECADEPKCRNRETCRPGLAEPEAARYNSPAMPARIVSISEVTPSAGVPGGELVIKCRGFKPGFLSKVLLGEVEALIVSASDDRIIVRLPDSPRSLGLVLSVGKALSAVFPFSLAVRLATDLHPVANPVVAPDGAIITTISGSRGQQVSQPLIRVSRHGDKIPYHCDITNPTGLAFSPDGQLYISSRHDGTVLRYTNFEQLEVVAEDLGIPCGIAFDSKGLLYVGDRTGKIYRIDASGGREEFSQLEPSIAAYHLAIDSEDRLYVTAPTFSMRDRLIRFSNRGKSESLVTGLARPQGMVFMPDGDLLLCAGYEGKKGVFRYSPKNGAFSHFMASPIPIGLAIAGRDIFLATRDSIYWTSMPGNAVVN
jgi:sugar lactone lactonase YvrE